MGATIQFNNYDAVILAYQNRNVEAWSIWQSKQFMFKGLGEADLAGTLKALENGGTNAIYTLKIYEGIEELDKIKSNTPDDGSFNFRLNAGTMELTQSAYTSAMSNKAILEKLEQLEKRLNEEIEEEEEENNLGAIGKILDHPTISPLIPVFLEKILGTVFKTPMNNLPQAMQPAAINGIGENDKVEIDVIIDKLSKYDPLIKLHLEKLLNIAETNNNLFNVIVNSI